MKRREDVLSEAVHECLKEMYKWAQPSIDIDELVASGFKDDKDNPLYRKHYLSMENFKYIVDSYVYAYGMKDPWEENFDTCIRYLTEGGLKDKYIPADGDKPGYRSYDKVAPLAEFIGQENTDKAIELIKECRNFYRHNREENDFGFTMSLGVGSPNSNNEEVEKYWQENGRPDFKIKKYDIDDVIYGSEEYENITVEDFIETLK